MYVRVYGNSRGWREIGAALKHLVFLSGVLLAFMIVMAVIMVPICLWGEDHQQAVMTNQGIKAGLPKAVAESVTATCWNIEIPGATSKECFDESVETYRKTGSLSD